MGVVDFLVLKEVTIDWWMAMKDWAKLTGIKLNDVRPQLGSSAVSTDVTSPSKLTNGFIVE